MVVSFTDKRMLEAMEFIIHRKKVKTEKDFLKSIGFTNVNNIVNIRSGHQSFRVKHIQKACEVYGLDGNFFLNPKHSKMFLLSKQLTPIELLYEAVYAIEKKKK